MLPRVVRNALMRDQALGLQADQTATVNASLKLGQAAETVMVNAEPPQVNTTTATMSEVVEQRRVVELPLNGRNAASLLLVVAGATPAPASGVASSSAASPGSLEAERPGRRVMPKAVKVDFKSRSAANNSLSVGLAPG